jgi:hypothetical protein
MNRALSDPNNHVPKLTPDDEWENEAEISLAGMLPPRRIPSSADDDGSGKPADQGLRIESKIAAGGTGASSRDSGGVDVREIGGDVVRLERPVPAPGKIHRVAASPLGASAPEIRHRHPRGEGRDWGVADKIMAPWLPAVGLGVFIVVTGTLILWPILQDKQNTGEKSVYSSVTLEQEAPLEGLEETETLMLAEERARRMFERYAKARGIDHILPLLRNGDALRETHKHHWRPQAIPADWKVSENTTWTVVPVADRLVGELEGTLPDFSRFCAVFVIEDGRLRLDWEATHGHGTATFAELESGSGDGAAIRGRLSEAAFFPEDFPEAEFRSMLLASPDGERSLWVYSKRGTATDEVLAELFYAGVIIEKTSSSHQVTLRLERPPGYSRPNQWIIGEVLHIGWVAR